MDKEKKKTLTISSNFKKKIDTSSLSRKESRKSYSIPGDKKPIFKSSKNFRKTNSNEQIFKNQDNKGKKFTRKFVEQQATKAFIKKEMLEYARQQWDKGYTTVLLGHYHQTGIIEENGNYLIFMGDWLSKFTVTKYDGKEWYQYSWNT